MDPRDSDKTTFVTWQVTFNFIVMPFGLCNAPATIQRLTSVDMSGLDPLVCLVYMDDIIVHSKAHDGSLGQTAITVRPIHCDGPNTKG